MAAKEEKKTPPVNAPLSVLTEDEAAHAAAAKQQEMNHRLIQEQEKKAAFQQQKVVARAKLLKQNDNSLMAWASFMTTCIMFSLKFELRRTCFLKSVPRTVSGPTYATRNFPDW